MAASKSQGSYFGLFLVGGIVACGGIAYAATGAGKLLLLVGAAIPWVNVHMLPDYAYFDHSAHVAAGVGCVSCHGRIDQMPVVTQVQPLTMGWCIDCHRDPAPHVRDPLNVTVMDFTPDSAKSGQVPVATNGRTLHPPTHCSGCHR